MNLLRQRLNACLLPLLLALALPAAATEVINTGAKQGQWTQDWDAALAMAKVKDLPVLVNFTGSDWCGWCKIMDRDVFSKEDWGKFASSQLVMAHIDFPRNQELVPAEYKERNDKLQERFKVEGYPTFVLLDSDGQTELGRLSAGQGKSPGSFAMEVRQVLRQRPSEIAKVAKALGEPQAKAYREALATSQEKDRLLRQWLATEPVENEANTAKFAELNGAIEKAKAAVEQFNLTYARKLLTPEQSKTYEANKASLAKAVAELQTWLQTRPTQTPENMEKFKAFQQNIAQLQDKIGSLEGQFGI
jgi:thioredoxin-related protein